MNIQEWKDSRRKTIELKSGLKVRVRHLSPFAIAELGPIPKLEDTSQENQLLSARRIVEAGMIEPKIGKGDEDLDLADLSMDDINEIVDAVVGIGKRPDEVPLAEGSLEERTPS